MYHIPHTSQEKPQQNQHSSNKTVITYQIDAIYHQLTTTRGALASVANTIIDIKRRHSRIKVTQEYVAKAAGYTSRTTGHTAMHKLDASPFMSMYRSRYYKNGVLWDEPCDIELNPILFTPLARQKLGDILPALHKIMCLSNLLSQRLSYQTCTLNKKRYTQVMMHPSQVLHSGVKLLVNYYLKKNGASPLPRSDAHEPSIILNNFLKREDYEQFASDIGAYSDYQSIKGIEIV